MGIASTRTIHLAADAAVCATPVEAPRGRSGVWRRVCALDEIPPLGARVVRADGCDVAIFRNADDEVFALEDRCPHKGGPLSQGIVHGRDVTCPLHGWKIGLDNGEARAPDVGCASSFAVRLDASGVWLEF